MSRFFSSLVPVSDKRSSVFERSVDMSALSLLSSTEGFGDFWVLCFTCAVLRCVTYKACLLRTY